LTSDTSWDPNAASFAKQEQIVSNRMDPIVHEIRMTDRVVPSPELMSVSELGERLISCVYVSLDDELHEGLDSTEGRRIQVIATKEKKTVITKETLARRWGIGTIYSDTMFLKAKSLKQNTVAQVYTDGQGYALFYPLKSKALAWTTVKLVVTDMNAIPETIVTDGAMEETGGQWKKEMQHYWIKQRFSEPYSQSQCRNSMHLRDFGIIVARSVDISTYAQFD
jgi:hypothetical protein